MTPKSIPLLALTMALSVPAIGVAASSAAEDGDASVYQMMKATESRVWRLNRRTGEIAVCTLSGERLTCTTTKEALSPAEAEARRKAMAEQAAADRRRQQQRDLAMLDKVLAFIRDLIGSSMEEGQ